MNKRTGSTIDLSTLSKHRLHVICSTVCLSVVMILWTTLILTWDDLFESDAFLPSQMVIGMISIWNIIACILLMVAMQTRRELVILIGFLAFLLGWLVGIVLIVRSSIKIIQIRNERAALDMQLDEF